MPCFVSFIAGLEGFFEGRGERVAVPVQIAHVERRRIFQWIFRLLWCSVTIIPIPIAMVTVVLPFLVLKFTTSNSAQKLVFHDRYGDGLTHPTVVVCTRPIEPFNGRAYGPWHCRMSDQVRGLPWGRLP